MKLKDTIFIFEVGLNRAFVWFWTILIKKIFCLSDQSRLVFVGTKSVSVRRSTTLERVYSG